MRTHGFTLLEMIVALGIFGVIGVMSSQLLLQSIEVTDRIISRGDRLSDVERAVQIIANDIQQITHRTIRDEFGERQASVLLDGSGSLEFTRHGWPNPLGEQRSNLLRVAYSVEQNQLVRQNWATLDRAPDAQPRVQVVLHGVESLEVEIVDEVGVTHEYWPSLAQTDVALAAVGLHVTIADVSLGRLSFVWAIPSEYFFATLSDTDQENPEEETGLPSDESS